MVGHIMVNLHGKVQLKDGPKKHQNGLEVITFAIHVT